MYIYIYIYIYICIYIYIENTLVIYLRGHSFYGEGIFLTLCTTLSVSLLYCFHPETSFVLDL